MHWEVENCFEYSVSCFCAVTDFTVRYVFVRLPTRFPDRSISDKKWASADVWTCGTFWCVHTLATIVLCTYMSCCASSMLDTWRQRFRFHGTPSRAKNKRPDVAKQPDRLSRAAKNPSCTRCCPLMHFCSLFTYNANNINNWFVWKYFHT